MWTDPRTSAVSAPPGASSCGAAADGVDPGQQFSGVVRLHHVVVGPEVEAVDAGADVGAGGDHDHRGAGALADLAADLVTVLVRQPQVEQDDAEAVAFRDEGLESFLPASGVRHVEPVAGQDRGQGGGDVIVVLDEEQSHPALLRFISRTIEMYENACTRARARCSHADGRGRRQVGSGCGPLPLPGRYAACSQLLRHVSDCYRIVMLRFPSKVMTQVAWGHYCPPKPRRTEP